MSYLAALQKTPSTGSINQPQRSSAPYLPSQFLDSGSFLHALPSQKPPEFAGRDSSPHFPVPEVLLHLIPFSIVFDAGV
jgi:hypothetical protein